MYYRKNYIPMLYNNIPLETYITSKYDLTKIKSLDKNKNKHIEYDFNTPNDYYIDREEYIYVGIIDQESTKKKIEQLDVINDQFKIRKSMKKSDKKRETGLSRFMGAVCIHKMKDSKESGNNTEGDDLITIANKIGIINYFHESRMTICELIKERLYMLEKFSRGDKKKRYLITPANHPTIPFPLNLEDRAKYIITKIMRETRLSAEPTIKITVTKGKYPELQYSTYTITYPSVFDSHKDIMIKNKATLVDGKWTIVLS
jgi:hypothetical protein